MSARSGKDDVEIGPQLLAQLREEAEVLGVYDEGQDIALDLHEELFNPSTRQRAIAFLQSPRYEAAAETYRRITTGAIDLPGTK